MADDLYGSTATMQTAELLLHSTSSTSALADDLEIGEKKKKSYYVVNGICVNCSGFKWKKCRLQISMRYG